MALLKARQMVSLLGLGLAPRSGPVSILSWARCWFLVLLSFCARGEGLYSAEARIVPDGTVLQGHGDDFRSTRGGGTQRVPTVFGSSFKVFPGHRWRTHHLLG